MQSHLLFSFITRLIFVTFCTFLLPAVFCAGCAGRKGEAFTQTIYAQDPGGKEPEDMSAGIAYESGEDSPDGSKSSGTSMNTPGPDARQICVFVCGAVVNEGVYYLPEGSRVIDAVNAAGGFSEDADPIYVNQAKYVGDEERVVIPTLEEAQELRSAEQSASRGQNDSEAGTDDGLININTASRKELMEIPGIGESKADRIIAYRESHGGFGAVEEIKNVSGIGGAVYDGLKGYIKVE